jgi:hypothetical protein
VFSGSFFFKLKKKKKKTGVAPVVECPLSKHETLSSKSSTTAKKKLGVGSRRVGRKL